MQTNRARIDRLWQTGTLGDDALLLLLTELTEEDRTYLHACARAASLAQFGNGVYIRGLIELSNYCKNDCYYCGIRKSNRNAQRYRLSPEEVLSCCREGYALGFRTFVLQGGEDPWFTPERTAGLIRQIRNAWPDCAITLSLGEHDAATYRLWYEAGADRYLLRHETANPKHYAGLHPAGLTLAHRLACLESLKKIGFQTGTGFMVGSPGQKPQDLVKDLRLVEQFGPEMIGIGPFVPHADTDFAGHPCGSLTLTLTLISILRLMLKKALIPATTALGTIHPQGREKGILAGANVVMPNLSPQRFRKQYALYNDKICTDEESAEGKEKLEKRVTDIGYRLLTDRGDYQTG